MMSAKAIESDTDKPMTPLVTVSSWFTNIQCIEHASFVIIPKDRVSFFAVQGVLKSVV